MTTTTQVRETKDGRVVMPMFSGEITAPAGVSIETVRRIASEFPPGSHSRKRRVIAALRDAAE